MVDCSLVDDLQVTTGLDPLESFHRQLFVDSTFDVLVRELVGCSARLRVNPVIGSVAAEVGRAVVVELHFLRKGGCTEAQNSRQTKSFHVSHCVFSLSVD